MPRPFEETPAQEEVSRTPDYFVPHYSPYDRVGKTLNPFDRLVARHEHALRRREEILDILSFSEKKLAEMKLMNARDALTSDVKEMYKDAYEKALSDVGQEFFDTEAVNERILEKLNEAEQSGMKDGDGVFIDDALPIFAVRKEDGFELYLEKENGEEVLLTADALEMALQSIALTMTEERGMEASGETKVYENGERADTYDDLSR